MTARRYVVQGRVQGVGFRYFVRSAGRSLRLRGWVRNMADGGVEVVAAGDADALRLLDGKLRRGPSGARVDSVSGTAFDGDDGALPYPFTISPNA